MQNSASNTTQAREYGFHKRDEASLGERLNGPATGHRLVELGMPISSTYKGEAF
jgi:hypothetical protein